MRGIALKQEGKNMPLPFLIGGLAALRGGKKEGSVKETVKRHNGNLEKLRIKEADCTEAVTALEQELLTVLRGLSGMVERLVRVKNEPALDKLTFSNVKLMPLDPKALKKAADEPEWFLSDNALNAGSYLLTDRSALTVSEDAEDVRSEMQEKESKINEDFTYYDTLQKAAERYAASLASVRELYETHLKVLDQFYEKFGRTDWNTFTDTERFATQNCAQLAMLLYEMCTVKLIKDPAVNGLLPVINEEEMLLKMEKAAAYCANKGFEYHGEIFDVILRGDAKNYLSYRYRLEDRLHELLPINCDQTGAILDKLRTNSNVVIARAVTQPHAAGVINKLRDIDIKSQRVPSPDKTGVFYLELVQAK